MDDDDEQTKDNQLSLFRMQTDKNDIVETLCHIIGDINSYALVTPPPDLA